MIESVPRNSRHIEFYQYLIYSLQTQRTSTYVYTIRSVPGALRQSHRRFNQYFIYCFKTHEQVHLYIWLELFQEIDTSILFIVLKTHGAVHLYIWLEMFPGFADIDIDSLTSILFIADSTKNLHIFIHDWGCSEDSKT